MPASSGTSFPESADFQAVTIYRGIYNGRFDQLIVRAEAVEGSESRPYSPPFAGIRRRG